MTPSGPPQLATFTTQPSWQNRAGRIDRSACVELKASDLWRDIPREHWQVFAPKPHKTSYLLATTTTDISAYQLADIHDTQKPFTLQGDLRTKKANALKPTSSRTPRSPRSPNVGTPSNLSAHTSNLPLNPNKGNTRTRMLGLPTDWSQPLTIQRWRLHANLAQHFFACPRCNKRALKLFLPMCTQEELRDSLTAHLWLNSNQKRIATSSTLRPQASQLLARYAPIFPPRQLQCRKCLALRYGESRP